MKKPGIKYQLRLSSLIPVMLVAILFALFYNREFAKDLSQHVSSLGQAYVRQLLPAAQLALMRNDRRTLQGLVDASMVNPDVLALAFYNLKGELVAYRGGKHSVHLPFKPPQFTGDYIESKPTEPYVMNFIAPVTIPKFNLYRKRFEAHTDTQSAEADDILGWLSLDIDTQSMWIKRYQMYIVTIFITLTGLLCSLIIHYFLSGKIYLPILRLRRSLRLIKNGQTETPIHVSSKGELGDIEQGCAFLQQQYLNTVQDLNHQIETATEDLQQSLELLEEKNIELSLEKKKIEEKSRQKSDFIANMSHEIRTPMNGVIGFTNVLLESKLDPLQSDYVQTIKTSAQDLLNIINDILDYSKIDAGKLNLDCIPLDLRGCIDDVLTLAAPHARQKEIDLIPVTEPHVPRMILGDPFRIKQILTNLIGNAIKFTDKGHVLIRTSLTEETDKDCLIDISVTDTGIGISNEDKNKLFNAFNQADTTITRRFGGTGLGLVICKKLAEAMHGQILLDSQPHKGSTFCVKIRLEKPRSFEEKNQAQLFEPCKVLCFDEDPLQLEALHNGLEYLGLECIPSSSLDKLHETFIDNPGCKLAFLNVSKGMEQSIEACIKILNIPCILMSRWLIHHVDTMGAHAFLYKPFSIQKLQNTLKSLFNNAVPSELSLELDALRQKCKALQPRILIAEDNPLNLQLMLSLFRDNAQIETAENGEMAVLKCKEQRFDLLLFDLQMPVLDGLEASVKIRSQTGFNQKTPIIVMSANSDDLKRDDLLQTGILICLQKPLDEKQFLEILLGALNHTPAIDWELCIKKFSGNKDSAQEFMLKFVQELHVNRADFVHLLSRNDISGLGKAAHKLHGACCFCGVPKLQQQIVRLEALAGQSRPIEELRLCVEAVLSCIDEVINEFGLIK